MQLYDAMADVLVGPVVRLLYRPRVSGLEHVPATGPVIIAANHLSMMDTVFLPVLLPRQVSFIAKADLFHSRSPHGRVIAWFLRAVRMIPVDRSGGSASQAGIDAAVAALAQGRVFGIFPEGTRSPDGRLYRARTGVARIALASGAPVVPVALVGTDALFRRTRLPRLRRVELRFGEPLDVSGRVGGRHDPEVLRTVTDEVQAAVQALSGQEYVDVYSGAAGSSREASSRRAPGQAPLGGAGPDAAGPTPS